MELEWMENRIGNGEGEKTGGREKNEDGEKAEKKQEKCRIDSKKLENALELKHRSHLEIKGDDAKMFIENSNWLKTKEAAEYLRTSPKQIRKWVYQGRINAYKLLGKSLRFKKTELDLLFKGGQSWE